MIIYSYSECKWIFDVGNNWVGKPRPKLRNSIRVEIPGKIILYAISNKKIRFDNNEKRSALNDCIWISISISMIISIPSSKIKYFEKFN